MKILGGDGQLIQQTLVLFLVNLVSKASATCGLYELNFLARVY